MAAVLSPSPSWPSVRTLRLRLASTRSPSPLLFYHEYYHSLFKTKETNLFTRIQHRFLHLNHDVNANVATKYIPSISTYYPNTTVLIHNLKTESQIRQGKVPIQLEYIKLFEYVLETSPEEFQYPLTIGLWHPCGERAWHVPRVVTESLDLCCLRVQRTGFNQHDVAHRAAPSSRRHNTKGPLQSLDDL